MLDVQNFKQKQIKNLVKSQQKLLSISACCYNIKVFLFIYLFHGQIELHVLGQINIEKKN